MKTLAIALNALTLCIVIYILIDALSDHIHPGEVFVLVPLTLTPCVSIFALMFPKGVNRLTVSLRRETLEGNKEIENFGREEQSK